MSKRSKPAAKYRGLSFPVPLLEEVKLHISNKPEYRSVSEFIRESIREKMHEEDVVIDDREQSVENVMFNNYLKNTNNSIENISKKYDKIQGDIDGIYKLFINIDERLNDIVPK
jgi:Arc/MetJ-type ribon-helix-helix transcriptional regulator